MAKKGRKINGSRRFNLGMSGLRTVKMLYPRCEVCQDPANFKPRWWETCEHDPYFSATPEKTTKQVWEEQDGEQVLVGVEEQTRMIRRPNLRQVAVVERVNSGREVEKRRAQGWLLPDEHPTDPLAPFCQYHECWSQDIKVRSAEYGDYCDENQARMVGLDYQGKPLHTDTRRRSRQLQEVWLG